MAQPEKDKQITIHIDKEKFRAPAGTLTGAELRALPAPPLGPDVDFYVEVPGPGPDELIDDARSVDLKNGMHFFTAPRSITPGVAA